MGYEQLLLHLFGDYITQTSWMANNKTKSPIPALVHAIVYAIPFLVVLNVTWSAFMVIWLTHYFIDHYRMAKYLIFVKNKMTDWGLDWADCDNNGFPKPMDPSLSTFLLIVTDNTLHLIINYLAIHYQ